MKLLATLALLAVTACGPTAYSKATTHQTMGGARYMITVRGNSRTTSSVVLDYTNRRATELCPRGYDVEQTAGGITSEQVPGSNMTAHKADVSTVVRCRE